MNEPVAKEPVYWNDFTLWDTTQLNIPDVGRNHILEFVLVPVRKIISVKEIKICTIINYCFLSVWRKKVG